MYKGNKILGLIPARGGSKGLPRKNILPLLGKPLIAWTIEQALACSYIDQVIISTDSNEIINISKKYGADVPFVRPDHLATDTARGVDVAIHAIEWSTKNNNPFNLVMLLQPTSPLRITEDLNYAIEQLFDKNAQAIVSVCETEHHPYWSNVLPADGSMNDFLTPYALGRNRQELPVFYRLNGAIYLAYCDYLRNYGNFLGENTYAYIMPQYRSIDIDTEIDFGLAELMLKKPIVYP